MDGMLRAETVDAVLAQAPDAGFTQIDPADRYGYARAFVRWWGFGGGLIIVEQDVVPAAGTLAGLWACPEPWCGVRIDCGRGPVGETLGVAKFSPEIMRAQPDFAARAAGRGKAGGVTAPWNALDGWVRHQMRNRSVSWHEHSPDATHLHAYPD